MTDQHDSQKRISNIGTYLSAILLLFLFGSLLSTGCKSEYEQAVEKGLASGERHDSIFFGLQLGMTADSFYKHCWELNKTQKFKQGQFNTSVEYSMDEFKYPAVMNFYPTFNEEGVVAEMPVMFNYKGWAPWNKKLWADSLVLQVKGLMEKWYGPGFIEMKHPEKGTRYVKVDGNRRIILWAVDDQYVKALFSDLTRIKKESEKETQKRSSKSAKENQLKDG